MFVQKTSQRQTSTNLSGSSKAYRQKINSESTVGLPLEPRRRKYKPKQTTAPRQQSSCRTERSSNDQKCNNIELILNNKSFWIDCEDFTTIETQLQKIFSDSSLNYNIRRSLSLIILERARVLNSNIKPLFQRSIQQYQKQEAANIESEVIQL